jgi:hypothetical protein
MRRDRGEKAREERERKEGERKGCWGLFIVLHGSLYILYRSL